MPNTQDPKQLAGVKKVPWSCVPINVIAEVAVAMYEGARKYGRHNYRQQHNHYASTYYEGTRRHLDQWWEGEDIDSDSGLNHIVKAIASLTVLRDTMIRGSMVDDRPPPTPAGFWDDLNKMVEELNAKYPDAKPMTTAMSGSAKEIMGASEVIYKANIKTGPMPRVRPEVFGSPVGEMLKTHRYGHLIDDA
jgi:hypothetical protein